MQKKKKSVSAATSLASEPRPSRASTNKGAKRGSTFAAVGVATKAAVPESTTGKGRDGTIAPPHVPCKNPVKASVEIPLRRDHSVSSLSDARRKPVHMTTEHTSPSLPTSSSNVPSRAMTKGAGTCGAGGVALPGRADTESSTTLTRPRGKRTSSCFSGVAPAPAFSSPGTRAASFKSTSPGNKGDTVSATRKSSTRGSVPLHLPVMRKDKILLAAAVKDHTSDEGRPFEKTPINLKSATTSVASLTYSAIVASGGASSDAFPAAVHDTLPLLRPLSSADYATPCGTKSPSRQPLRKTLSNPGSHRSSGCVSACNMRASASRASFYLSPMAPPLPTMIAASPSELGSNNTVVDGPNLRDGGANENRRARHPSQKSSSHSVAVDRAGGDGGDAMLFKDETNSAASRADAQSLDDHREEEDSGGGGDGADLDEGEASDEDDSGSGSTDSSSGDEDDDDDEDDDEEEEEEEEQEEEEDGGDDDCVSARTSCCSSGNSSTRTVDGGKNLCRPKKCDNRPKPRPGVIETTTTTSTLSSVSRNAQSGRRAHPTAQSIRTKVSREGDVNVKVIFAVRDRNCFRRYLQEVMNRFGFQKVTDFDMYCIDQYGDRVDIDMEDDFDQLLDTFTATITAGKEFLGRSQEPGTSPRPPPMSSMGLPPHVYGSNQHTSTLGVSVLDEGLNTAGPGSERARSSNASNSHGFPSHVAKPHALSTGLDATVISSISASSLMEDDVKSSGSALRLYVRYSNAYYTEHRQDLQQQQQLRMQQLAIYPQGLFSDDGSAASLRQGMSPRMVSPSSNHQQQQQHQLSLGSSSNQQGFQADQLISSRLSFGATGSPLTRTLRSSTAGSLDEGGRCIDRPASPEELDVIHGHATEVPCGSSGSVSLPFNETLRSSLAHTFKFEEGELVDWRRMSVLGKGSFGTVYEGITQDGKMLAVKVQELPLDDDGDAEAVKALKMEINLMRSLKHKNIVTYYGCQTRVLPTGNQQMEVFLELCHGGSLASLRRKLLKAKEPFSISLVRSYTRQVLEGLAYLHAQNVVHRDIKSDNVLISAVGEAKLADFGCSKRVGPATLQSMSDRLPSDAVPNSQEATAARAAMYQTVVGSPFFMAPEVLREDGGYTRAADIWSVGCLVLELLGREPWDITGTNIFQIMFRISKEKGMPTGVPKACPKVLLDFLQRCFQRDPKQRATAAELLAHAWLTCHDKELEEVPPLP